MGEDARSRESEIAEACSRDALESARVEARSEIQALAERLRACVQERDAAVARLSELDSRINPSGESDFAARQRALELEIQLVRSRLERETEARCLAEKKSQATHAQL